MEQQIDIAYKLYRARRTVKSFCGDSYQERIAPYQEVIREQMPKHNNNELQTVLFLADSMKDHVFGTLLLLAAAVEMIEPSK